MSIVHFTCGPYEESQASGPMGNSSVPTIVIDNTGADLPPISIPSPSPFLSAGSVFPSTVDHSRSPGGAYSKGYKPMTHQVTRQRGLEWLLQNAIKCKHFFMNVGVTWKCSWPPVSMFPRTSTMLSHLSSSSLSACEGPSFLATSHCTGRKTLQHTASTSIFRFSLFLPPPPPPSHSARQDFLRSSSARRRYWARSYVGWKRFAAAQPGPTHRALARLHSRGHLPAGLITQNVDR